MSKRVRFWFIIACLAMALPAVAGGHTWDVRELFSDATGTIQFVEVWEANGGANETATGGHDVTSSTTGNSFTIPANVPPPTSNKSILLATAAFAALPGAPTPDHIVSANFFSTVADTITYVPYDNLSFTAGQLPTDGLNSFSDGAVIGPMTPENYAGQTWAPPGVPDGAGGSPVTVTKLAAFPAAERMTLTYDVSSCPLGNTDHQIIYGFGSQLPAAPGGTYLLSGARCNIGSTSPFVWSGVPDPQVDPSRLLWFLVVTTQIPDPVNPAGIEGAWGTDSSGAERSGPVGGVSGQCDMVTKNLANVCGQ